jgi:putative nucleotidyltransferase with HDIG domain
MVANALDMRSPHFHGHSRAVAMQAAAIAQHMGLSEEEIAAIHTAGLLHDVGMMAVPDTIVEKTSALTADEFAVIKSHCQRGVEILAPMRHLGRSIRYVQEHHERIDGSGYPDGKQGEEISLGGQIVGISEAWVAILESRAHRLGMSREEGLALIRGKSGVWFSERVTEALERSDVGMI